MKKILSIALCAVMAVSSVVSVSATTDSDVAETPQTFTILDEDTIPDNILRMYTYGSIDTSTRIKIKDNADSMELNVLPSSIFNVMDNIPLSSTEGYKIFLYVNNSGGNYFRDVCFNEKGGTYEKIRIKLSDLSSSFNEDGTTTANIDGNIHDYNFTNEGNGYRSSLLFVSGGAFTFAAPDENGCVEIYVSTKIGERSAFMERFSFQDGSTSGSGGTSGSELYGFMIGDVNKNDYLSVTDATAIQRYIANKESFDSMQMRSADVNRDGVVNISDATIIQKYLVQ